MGNTVQGPEDCILQILACKTSASLQFDEISKCPTADSSIDLIVGDTEPEPGIRSSSKINVHVPEPSVQEGDEDVLDLIIGDTEPKP